MAKDLFGNLLRAVIYLPQDRLMALVRLAQLMEDNRHYGYEWHAYLKKLARMEAPPQMLEENFILQLLPCDPLFIPSCDGKETLRDAEDVFEHRYLTITEGPRTDAETAETSVLTYRLASSAPADDAFDSLGRDRDELCVTQNQIVAFCRQYRGRIWTDWDQIVFMFKDINQDYEEFVLASITVNDGKFDLFTQTKRLRFFVNKMNGKANNVIFVVPC